MLSKKIFVGVVFGVASVAVSQAALVSHFSFDGNAENSVLGQADGVEAGTVLYVAGRYGQAVSLDSINDSIDLGSTSLGAIGSGDFTVSLWVNMNGQSVSGDPALFSNKNWNSGNNLGINLAVKGSLNIDVNTHGGATRVDFDDAETTNISATGWNNLVLVRDGNSLSYFYNGVQENSTKILADGANFISANSFKLGDDGVIGYNDAGHSWTGEVLFDELSVYDVALNQAQITALQSVAVVPEPSSSVMLGLCGITVLLRRRR